MGEPLSPAEEALREAAFEYHRAPTPRQDLGHADQAADQPARPVAGLLAGRGLSPAWRSRRIPNLAAEYTARGNLVGVVTNGTAVLGLGDIGPLAGKPVMEGKGCLFKKFAGIDVFDIELAEKDPDKLIEIIAALEPTLGGINLEDIKAPECFYIERDAEGADEDPGLPRRPARHGDHLRRGAAQRAGAGRQADRRDQAGRLRVPGAAAIACLDVMVGLGVKRENIFVVDSRGVVQHERATRAKASSTRASSATARRRRRARWPT